MNRILGIVVRSILFSWLAFPTLAMAQAPQSGRLEENTNGKNVASLTTTDLLSKQDFAPLVMELAARRSRTVNPVQGGKSGVGLKPTAPEGALGKANAATTGSPAAVAEVMQPTVRRAPLPAETSALPVAPSLPLSTGSHSLDDLITQAARRNGLDQRLILAVMQQESSFNARATSYKGARGLMQLMPATASRFGVTDIYDPAQNIEGGARYLRFLLDTFQGDVELALAGYNAGENAVIRYGNRIPPYRETQDYVRKISAHYTRLTNGTMTFRPAPPVAPAPRRRAESELLTVGATMTQY